MLHYFETARSLFKPLNESKLLMGIIMIFLNVASKYIELGFSKTQEQALRNGLGREILIFALAFTATKDLVLAIIITASFVILSDVLFHEESRFCLMPERMKKLSKLVDTNKDGVISKGETERAIKILENANKNSNNGAIDTNILNNNNSIENFQMKKRMNYM
jgi:hypothetical protein